MTNSTKKYMSEEGVKQQGIVVSDSNLDLNPRLILVLHRTGFLKRSRSSLKRSRSSLKQKTSSLKQKTHNPEFKALIVLDKQRMHPTAKTDSNKWPSNSTSTNRKTNQEP